MKTGRLLKFDRPGAQVHAYFYLDAGRHRAALYVMPSGQLSGGGPVHSITGDSDAAVEAAARAWVDDHFPRKPLG
jgi:hypothetical protein